MINVRAAANTAIQVVNANILIALYRSTGFTVDANTRKQVPAYAVSTPRAQVQAISARDLKLMQSLNIEGVLRSVHMYGNTQGVVRIDAKGGDLLYFPEVPAGTARIWKVVKVMETWPTWCRVIVCLQTDTAPPI